MTARLAHTTALSDFTRHLEFEIESSPKFGFVPGQWLSLTRTKPGGEELTRAYSIASPPDGSRFALCLNRVQDGFMSNYLCDLEVGAEISAQGPFGKLLCVPLPHRFDVPQWPHDCRSCWRRILIDIVDPHTRRGLFCH